MIYLYSGTPGSGKSLHMAKDIYDWLRWGNVCICNFDVNVKNIPKAKGQFIFLNNDNLSPEILIKFSKVFFSKNKFKEGALRLYIDEAQLLFNARDWAQKGRKGWLSFFSQHRKYGYDIYLVAQFDRMIDKQIRSLIEYEFIHRKVKNFGRTGNIFNAVAGGSLFVVVKVWYPLKEQIGSQFIKGTKKYYSLYDTLDTFD